MTANRVWIPVSLLLCLSLNALAKSKEGPYPWPALPDPTARQSASSLKNDGGLVVLERRTKFDVDSSADGEKGLRMDDFVRLLIVGQDGVRGAAVPLNIGSGFTLEKVEGRTVASDGSVTALDEEKDVERTDTTRFGDDEALQSHATVNFPAPTVGSVLDLHYVCVRDQTPTYFSTTLLYNLTTTVKCDIELRFHGELAKWKWNMLTFGDSKGAVKLEALDKEGFAAHMGAYEMETREKDAPPSTHTSPMLLCYVDLSGIKTQADSSKITQSKTTLDCRGRIQGLSFPLGDAVTQWWAEYLKKDRKLDREFMRKPGKAESVDVDGAAPPTLPLEERLAKLYRLTQETVRHDPHADRVFTISDVFARGSTGWWQGTLVFAYFLDRAKIDYHLALVADREALRFSPLIRNEGVYSFATAVVVPRPGKAPLVAMPGDLSLGYGLLPYDRQDALAFWLEGEETVHTFYTSPNDPDADGATFRYALEMDGAGNAKGTVTLSERGAECRGFRRWYVLRELGAKSPARDKEEDKSEAERTLELNEELEDWFWYPGDQFTFSGYELVRCVQDSTVPLEIKAQATGKGIGQANGDRWLVLANPLLAGYSNPYVRSQRKFAIWNDAGGKRVLEGEILLPAGAKVSELPKPQEVRGPEGLVARSSVEMVERDGRVLLKSRLEYGMPLILGSDLYGAYRLYLDALTKMGQERCIVQLSAEKELE